MIVTENDGYTVLCRQEGLVYRSGPFDTFAEANSVSTRIERQYLLMSGYKSSNLEWDAMWG